MLPALRHSVARPALATCLVLVACGGGGGGGTTTAPPVSPPAGPTASQYQNPVLNADFPDPGVTRGADNAFYAYATQTTGLRIQASRSTDLVTWSAPGEALPTKPRWASQSNNFWAPDVQYRADLQRYVMYFSAQADSLNGGFCVGMATSTTALGPFTDVGRPVVCGAAASTIDPQGFDDPVSGKKYLYWGSAGYPLYVQELAADRASFAAGSSPVAVATTRATRYEKLIEGAWVTYRAPYYYLFYSGDNCCVQFGPVSYAVMVARATSPTGPFATLRAADGSATPVLAAGGSWLGPGHNAVVTVNGTDWMVYHAIDGNNPTLAGTGASRRVLLIDKITYGADGWPVVGNAGVPTSTPQTRPIAP